MFGFAAPVQSRLGNLDQWASQAQADTQRQLDGGVPPDGFNSADMSAPSAAQPNASGAAGAPGQAAPGTQGPSVSDIFHTIAQHFGGSGQPVDPNTVVNMNAGAGPSAAARALSGSSDSPQLIKYLASFLG